MNKTTKKSKKIDLDYKKIAIAGLIVTVVILSIILLFIAIDSKRQVRSEMISLTQVESKDFKEKNEVLADYKAYKNFLSEYNVKGKLAKKDFRKNDYIVSIQSYAKDVEYAKKKFVGLEASDINGLVLSFDAYGYCDDVKSVERIAYLIPVTKDDYLGAKEIKNEYNYLEDSECKKVGE